MLCTPDLRAFVAVLPAEDFFADLELWASGRQAPAILLVF
jgi:hypothetical protein